MIVHVHMYKSLSLSHTNVHVHLHTYTVHFTRDNVDDTVGHSQRLVELLCIINHLIHDLPGDVIMRTGDAKLLNLQCIRE